MGNKHLADGRARLGDLSGTTFYMLSSDTFDVVENRYVKTIIDLYLSDTTYKSLRLERYHTGIDDDNNVPDLKFLLDYSGTVSDLTGLTFTDIVGNPISAQVLDGYTKFYRMTTRHQLNLDWDKSSGTWKDNSASFSALYFVAKIEGDKIFLMQAVATSTANKYRLRSPNPLVYIKQTQL